jgi:hypothetical protein
MALDRDELMSHRIGWNWELRDVVGGLVDIEDIDLLDGHETQKIRGHLADRLMRRRIERIQRSGSPFLLDFFPSAEVPRDFSLFLGNLPYESVRILLIFFGNLFQFTYLRCTNRVCPFCPGEFSSTHFFLCPHTPPPFNDYSALVNDFRISDFRAGIDRIFLTLQRWASITRNFQPGFGAKIEEYFQYT